MIDEVSRGKMFENEAMLYIDELEALQETVKSLDQPPAFMRALCSPLESAELQEAMKKLESSQKEK